MAGQDECYTDSQREGLVRATILLSPLVDSLRTTPRQVQLLAAAVVGPQWSVERLWAGAALARVIMAP
ncbi:hypothetical protein GCM10023086_11060 [Streptomyces venetus]|uniref:Uncharacterized protein n=1 Tax=Streptomyces venetus TaxID=1701086 RepID=A0ABP8F7Z5_9ACTN